MRSMSGARGKGDVQPGRDPARAWRLAGIPQRGSDLERLREASSGVIRHLHRRPCDSHRATSSGKSAGGRPMTTRRKVEMRSARHARVLSVSEGVSVIRVDASLNRAEMIELASARQRPVLSLVKPDVRQVSPAVPLESAVTAGPVERSSPDPARRREALSQARNSKRTARIETFSEAGREAVVAVYISEILPFDMPLARFRFRSAPGSSPAAAFAEAIHG
jgi:hypothetical protein